MDFDKDGWYSGIGSIDVHYSSGPANHFFYLLFEGSDAKTNNGVSYRDSFAVHRASARW